MNGQSESPFQATLAELDKLAQEHKAPNHYHARFLLLALGFTLLEEGETEATEQAAKILLHTEPHGEAWEHAVAEEFSIACAEHIQGVEPRYLELENFDFEYVKRARERLEARFQAAALLGIGVEASLLKQVTSADERLESFLK